MTAGRIAIGLVGHVCAGKSTVAKAFQQRGADVFQADRLVHELYRIAEVKKQVRDLAGGEVFDAKGEVDRKALGALVFADEKKLKALTEQIIYPRTGEVLRAKLEEFRRSGRAPALVLDAPTLFESGRNGLCDRMLFVAAPRARREQWAQAQRGWSPEELSRRESRLMNEQEKRDRCDAVLENDGTPKDLDRRVGALWDRWIAGTP